tara:strand:- start:2182 stop:2511 length:330 start_codon:yes stop_codon:yes gene_type:complete
MSETKSQEPGYMVIDPIIWQDASLNDREKILLSFVWGFTRMQKGCFAPATWIADNFGWDYPFTTLLIENTKTRGWITVHPNGCMSINIPGSADPCYGDVTDIFDIDVEV